jgi:hypothetical protein
MKRMGIAAAVACGVCCAVPLIAALTGIGVASSVGAALRIVEPVSLALAALSLVGAAVLWVRRRPRKPRPVVDLGMPLVSTSESWAPHACTLPTADRPLRMAEFDELLGAVRGVERTAPSTLSLTLEPTPDRASRVADLAMRETGCCSFFTFALTASGGVLRLDITVPAEQLEILDALAARVEVHA